MGVQPRGLKAARVENGTQFLAGLLIRRGFAIPGAATAASH